MSQENVEIVRRAYEVWNEGDYAAFIAALDPEIELVLPSGGLTEGTRRGHRAVREFLEGYVESFESFQVEPERFLDEADRVAAFVRVSGRGRGSGVRIEDRPLHVITLRCGKVQRIEVVPDRYKQQALEAVGLRE